MHATSSHREHHRGGEPQPPFFDRQQFYAHANARLCTVLAWQMCRWSWITIGRGMAKISRTVCSWCAIPTSGSCTLRWLHRAPECHHKFAHRSARARLRRLSSSHVQVRPTVCPAVFFYSICDRTRTAVCKLLARTCCACDDAAAHRQGVAAARTRRRRRYDAAARRRGRGGGLQPSVRVVTRALTPHAVRGRGRWLAAAH